MNGRRSAFTLVELLVVIGIIGLLIAILLPVLSKVKEQSVATKCASNLRGLGQAWVTYHQTNKGYIVPGRAPFTTKHGATYGIGRSMAYRPAWFEFCGDQLRRYANDCPSGEDDDSWTVEDEWFICPAVPERRNSRNYPFGYNFQFLGNARKRPDGAWVQYPVKISSIKASQTVMAADCLGTAAGIPPAQRRAYYNDGTKDPAAIGNKGVFLDPPRLTAKSDVADPPHRKYRSAPDPRHNGRANVVFCDGHVEALSPQALGYLVAPDGSIPPDGPGAHNRMFSGTGNDDDPPPAL